MRETKPICRERVGSTKRKVDTSYQSSKWDGTNSLEGKVNGEIDIVNRDGVHYGLRGNLPEINADLAMFPDNTVIHSELVGFNGNGVAHLNLVSGRCRRESRIDITDDLVRREPGSYGHFDVGPLPLLPKDHFSRLVAVYAMAHDILMLEGRNLEHMLLVERKALLGNLIRAYPFHSIRETQYVFDDGRETFSRAYEGVIAKWGQSTYVHGRTRALMKIKKRITEVCDVVGYYDGAGKRASTIGGLVLTQNGKYVGRVGSFKNYDDEALGRLGSLIRSLPITTKPFRIDRTYYAVKTDMKVTVRALNRTDDGILREPIMISHCVNSVTKDAVVETKPKDENTMPMLFDGNILL